MKNTNVMSRAWGIARVSAAKFGGTAREYFSEALKISWKMDRLAKLEDELFLLNMRETGGKYGVAYARATYARIDEVQKQITALKADIYPTVRKEERYWNGSASRFQLENMLKSFKPGSEQHNYFANELEKGWRISVYDALDENAYSAA